ncbi:MAG: AmmeMemoRadiSam system protein B [bacterium]|nr:AmmeMemoRadiSam system protein B [bacterium]
MIIREPIVAGSFYPASREALSKLAADYASGTAAASEGYGGLAPHAGYVYSGATAGKLFSSLKLADTVILLGPKHNYAGAEYAVWESGAWETPLGAVDIAEDIAAEILTHDSPLIADQSAHLPEHSLEVLLPFIQTVKPDAKIVPIAVGPMNENARLRMASAIAKTLAERGDCSIIISSDMSHYVSAHVAERLDNLAIEQMAAMNPAGLITTVKDNHISMCGVWSAALGMTIMTELGASEGELVHYTNSGEVSGDFGHVVGYAAIKFI